MNMILVDMARAFKVSTSEIVDHLDSKGFQIKNEPNFAITTEMYDELVLHFQKVIVIKDATKKINTGSSNTLFKLPHKDEPNEGDKKEGKLNIELPKIIRTPLSPYPNLILAKPWVRLGQQPFWGDFQNQALAASMAFNFMENKQLSHILKECYTKKVTLIDLGNFSLTSIPTELNFLPWLEGVNFGSSYGDMNTKQWIYSRDFGSPNNFSHGFSFPENLSNIVFLNMNDCEVKSIDQLIQVKKLKELWLNNNKITNIKPISELKELTYLSLSNNEIIKIHDLAPLEYLQYLDLANNQIKDIHYISHLKKLERLDLSDNQIESIESLSNLSQLKEIKLKGNPIEDCPPEIWESEDIRVIKGYFEARKRTQRKYSENILESKEVKHQEVKLILVGNSGTGKTQLREFLCTGRYTSKRRSTHGIEVFSWKKDKRDFERNEYFNEFLPTDFTINVWDFGGQEYYHGTHQLFLSNNAIYVLLWEKDTNNNLSILTKVNVDQEEKFFHFDYHYWLESIRYYAPSSPIFIVQNKVDDGIKERINEGVFETYKIKQDAFYISLHETAFNANKKQKRLFANFVADLCDAMLAVGKGFPNYIEWINIRDKIKELSKDTSNLFYVRSHHQGKWISLDIFKKTAAELEPALSAIDNEFDALILWLHSTGCIIHYSNNPKLKEKIFLDPHWITSGIYKILNIDALKNKGIFSRKDFQKNDPNSELLIDLMEQMEIVFQNPANPTEYIAPQYLDEEHPIEDLFSIAQTGLNQSSLKIRVPLFFYRKLMHRLIIYFGTEADVLAKYYWKHGVIFVTKEGTRCIVKGLYPQTGQEGIILIGIENTSEALNLKKEIFSRILIILSNREKASMDSSKLEALGQKKQDKNKTNLSDGYNPYHWYEIQKGNPSRWLQILELSIDDFGFISFISLCKSIEENLFKIKTDSGQYINLKHFNFLIGEKIPRPIKVFLSYAHKDLQLMRRLDIHLTPLKRLDKIETWTDRDILPGNDWDTTIQKNLDEADLVLLLITADFIASKYIWEKELAKIIMKHEKGEVEIIPILLQPVDFESLEFTKLKMIPSTENGELKPVALWESMEQGFSEVAKAIRTKIEDKTIYD